MSTLALSLGRRRASLWGVLAVIAAIATGLAVYSYLSYLRAQVPLTGVLVPMVVAANDLAPGRVIESGDLTVVRHPERYLPPDSLGSSRLALGKTVTIPIYKGETITSKKLGTQGGISSVVPPGLRGYSLRIDSGAAPAFLPEPGDVVDVIVTFPKEVLGEPTSITVLRGKQVAAVGTSGSASSGEVAEKLGLEGPGIESSGFALTLFVSPQEAERLAMAESLGRITIVLAPLSGDQGEQPAPIRPQDLTSP